MNLSDFNKKLDRLKSDNIHGATYIENQLLKTAIQAARHLKHHELKRFINSAGKWRTVMANILNLAAYLDKITDLKQSEFIEAVKLYRDRLSENRSVAADGAAAMIKRYKSIVTISSSSMVKDAIIKAIDKGWRGEVMIAESRPNNEGRSLARELSKLPIKVVFGTDTQIISIAYKAGAAFIGADMYTSKFFVNKTGTGALIRAMLSGRRAYIVTDRSKYLSDPGDILIANMPSSEVWADAPARIEVLNKYFEKINYAYNCIIIDETA